MFNFRVDPSGKPVEGTDDVPGSPLLEKVCMVKKIDLYIVMSCTVIEGRGILWKATDFKSTT
jgi:hypothetical protein